MTEPSFAQFASAYADWIAKNKIDIRSASGLQIERDDLHPRLRPYQKDIVLWALRRGHGLISAIFGAGKTTMQIEILRQVHRVTGAGVLVICPLGVRTQFIHEDGPAMGTDWRYVRTDEEADAALNETPYLITNYERVRDGNITQDFIQANIAGVCMDEAAILGNLGTKTLENFRIIFDTLEYKWAATATPAPNDYRQMIYFGDFFDELDAGQALTRWFGRNPDKAGDLQLLPNMEREFWMWVASWALFMERPSDLGDYDDSGFELPEMELVWHRLTADHSKAWDITDENGQSMLFKDTKMSATVAMREKRDSLEIRLEEVQRIMAENPGKHWIIWHHLEDERKAIQKWPNVSAVWGSQDLEKREEIILDFSHGKLPILAVKPEIAGSGCNFQYHCSDAIYAGLNFKFRDFIQSVHRLYRPGQKNKVTIHLIHTDAEDRVADELLKDWARHDELMATMKAIVKEFGLTREALVSGLKRSIGVERKEAHGEKWTAVLNDTVLECAQLPDNSVDCIVTSIPFGNHYEYSANRNDFGFNDTDEMFWRQMDFLIPSLYRALKPGRMACIHVKDRLLYGHQTKSGLMQVSPFSDDCARAFTKHGFVHYGRITIPTDVVRENKSSNRLGWSRNAQDSTVMGVGLPEYVILFRKPQSDKTQQWADERVTKNKATYTRARWQVDAHSLWRTNGQTVLENELPVPMLSQEQINGMTSAQLYNYWFHRTYNEAAPYDYEAHVELCERVGSRLPAHFMLMPTHVPFGTPAEEFVWTNILFFHTLNMANARRRLNKHVCPFPVDIPRRLIVRFSNPGDLILDPFGGLGTTAVVALEEGRRARIHELNADYWANSTHYLELTEIKASAPTLFDLSAVTVDSHSDAVEDVFALVSQKAA